MQRFNLILIPGILAVLIFLGVDFFEQARDPSSLSSASPESDFTSYSEGINSVQFDELGRIRYTLSARRQVSYVNDETALEEPFIQLYQEDDSRWNIIARSGRIFAADTDAGGVAQELEEIILSGNVEVYQFDELGNRTVLATDILTIDPETDVLTTESDVTMTGVNFEQIASGMRIHLDTEETVFYRNVRGKYATRQD